MAFGLTVAKLSSLDRAGRQWFAEQVFQCLLYITMSCCHCTSEGVVPHPHSAGAEAKEAIHEAGAPN